MLMKGTLERYKSEVELHKHAGMNLIRVWGGGLTERPEFYQACDEAGVMVMQEFWMSGDNNGRWAGDYDWPEDKGAYLTMVEDMVMMVRHHASLLFWCGGNELWPRELNPPPEIQRGLTAIVEERDGRFLIMSSMDGGYNGLNMSDHDDSYGLSVKDGPYGFLNPSIYFSEVNPGMTNGSTVQVSFQPEVGAGGIPRLKGMERMGVSQKGEFPGIFDSEVPENWVYHKFEGLSFYQNTTLIDPIYAYGAPKTLKDYVVRGNLACHQQYQSLFEGFSSKMFGKGEEGGKTAIIMWKTQSPWPALRGFLYDYWLEGTGSLDGAQAALNAPASAQWNLHTNEIEVVNRGVKDVDGSVFVDAFDLNGRRIDGGDVFTPESPVLPGTVWRSESPLKFGTSDVFFVRVQFDGKEKWYWRRVDDEGLDSYDYGELGKWRDEGPFPHVKMNVDTTGIDADSGNTKLSVKISVTGDTVCFAPVFTLLDGNNGEPILPIFVSGGHTIVLNDGVEVEFEIRTYNPNAKKLKLEMWAGETIVVQIDDDKNGGGYGDDLSDDYYSSSPLNWLAKLLSFF